MKIGVDSNWIVCVGAVLNETREYGHVLSWFSFSRCDTMVVARHKKELKIINWKNIGDGMSVFCFLPRKEVVVASIDQGWFSLGFGMFQWFDEETWKITNFLYKVSEKDIETIQQFLSIHPQDITINKTEKGIFVDGKIASWDSVGEEQLWNLDFVVSFLFALVLLYGKFEVKNQDLLSAKIHIPLFGVYENKKDFFDTLIDALKAKWIFLQKSIVESNNGIVYQIACQDYEILNAFKTMLVWSIDIQNVLKYEQTKEIQQSLQAFVEDAVQLHGWIIKVLSK